MANQYLEHLKNRAKEPSTYAGIGALGVLLKVSELAALGVPEVALAAAGVAAIFLPEQPRRRRKKKPAAAPVVGKKR